MIAKDKSRRPEADLEVRDDASRRGTSTREAADDRQHDQHGANLWARGDGFEDLPYRAELERSFGQSLDGISVKTGMADELASMGARALTDGNRIAFADKKPSLPLVAHEVTHVVQNRKAGQVNATGAAPIAPAHSAAESEAEGAASLVAAHGTESALPAITAPPGAGFQLSPQEPVVVVDKSADGAELRRAAIANEKPAVFAVLQRNANPQHMYALCKASGMDVARYLHRIMSPNEWARARAYLGEMVPLDLQLETHDKDAIFRDLSELPDARALDLCMGSIVHPFMVPAPAMAPTNQPPPTHAPAPTTFSGVQQVLRSKLDANDYTKAMRLLLDKADRAMKAKPKGLTPPGLGPNDFMVTGADVQMDPTRPDRITIIFADPEMDPVSAQRVILAEERIRAADAAGNTAQAFMSLTDLDLEERKALALRLKEKPLAKATDLGQLAEQTDDATMIQTAFVRAQYETYLYKQTAASIDLDAAMARAGDLVRNARMKLDAMSPNAPAAERKQAEDELRRLESMFFGSSREAGTVKDTLKIAANNDPKLYAEKLRAMGADPVTVGREMLQMISWTDFDALIGVLKAIPAEHRIKALEAADMIGIAAWPGFNATHQELLRAYIEQGRRAEPINPAVQQQIVLSPDFNLTGPGTIQLVGFGGPSPEATIALHEILAAMDRGPFAVDQIIPRLARMNQADYTSVVTDPRFLDKLAKLPTDDVDQRDFKSELTKAAGGKPRDAEARIVAKDFPSGPGHPGRLIELEAMRVRVGEQGGQARMRRGYVIAAQIEANPALATKLSDADRADLDAYRQASLGREGLDDDAQKTAADEITLGQPQLGDSPDAALDCNAEAEYMRVRLHKAAKVPIGKDLASWHHDRPAVTEALNQFEALYVAARPAGINRSDLIMLAEIYYRGLREIAEWDKDLAENEGLAKLAAMVAGVVIAIAVTALTGGVLGPVAVGALAAISAGTASAVAGAAVRWEDTDATIMTDFGSGAVEGIATVAGAGLASKIVRGASVGMSAGRAAVEVGSKAARVGGTLASQVAEAAIDGAVGGAAGELFTTAVDEATWDRGVGEAMAKMLGAILRGAAMGAAAGGAMGGLIGGLGRLAAKSSGEVAHGVGHLLDSGGAGRKILDGFADAEHVEIAHAYRLIESGKLDEAEHVLRNIKSMPAKAREMFIEAARARSAIRSSPMLEHVDLNGESYFPKILDDAEFMAKAGDKRAHAFVLVENGKPTIYARKGASPQAIKEEVVHVHQFYGDVAMRQRMERLSKESLDGFDKLEPAQKLERHIDKLEVEADAKRHIIKELEHEALEDAAAGQRLMDAQENLFLIEQRLQKLRGVDSSKWFDAKALKLDETPHLFDKTAHSPPKIKGKKDKEARKALIGVDVNKKKPDDLDELLKKHGYTAHRDPSGDVFRITRHPDHSADLPHLQIEGGKIKLGTGAQTFEEKQAAAAAEWTDNAKRFKEYRKGIKDGTLQGDDATKANKWMDAHGGRFHDALERRVNMGSLDEASAGLLSKWGGVAEKLASDAKGTTDFTLTKFFDEIPLSKGSKHSLTEPEVDKLRRFLRNETLDYVEKLDMQNRMEALHKMLDAQPDPGSKGELFHQYRERFMGSGVPASKRTGPYQHADEGAKTMKGRDLENPRTADGVMDVQKMASSELPPGKYAIDDKAGEGAFKMEQARDYAKRASEAGFSLEKGGKSEYDGLVYVFANQKDAEKAIELMADDVALQKVLGRDRGGIHVMYFREDTGGLKRATDLVPAKAPAKPKSKSKSK